MESKNYHIRHWKKQDLKLVRELALQIWIDAYRFLGKKDIQEYHDIQYSLSKLKQKFKQYIGLVAIIDQRIVAYSIADEKDQKSQYYIISLYVLPEFQGLGIGSSLLMKHAKMAKEKGQADLWLGVMELNTFARRWYQAIGFRFKASEDFQIGSESVKLLVGSTKIDDLLNE